MDRVAAARVIALFESRGQLDRLASVGATAAPACLDRAKQRLAAAAVLAVDLARRAIDAVERGISAG